ncbi:MAG: PAS domain S-box protein [Candidatus Thiodiazotropha lotti]|uniref:PAS domain S-box protein n=1 Tax=Candidatus Thiodiazotropha lotti TaxID=2792787 RepID=A0A9E4K2A5_9GAMM|nr:PAS domain-containing protein [Candidatus Thiodiazotropha endoloripes]MCG7871260.1 PAS domain S-box protein [Candidatus Thiodiazotropha lotti]MCG7914003.1 PAS domain S-box protein [Candidatus Thiodiazotropha weberae]MCG7938032.1 PAS domain S-box protein [Candidatus Thiodiazotropha lotti]MCG7990204.1 PAS domain S-box protein [Candidatus Thiodiazotropha lotti]MCG7999160.1 PAS domain S-box protein [Candidatus Thiodiazotropha lotti]
MKHLPISLQLLKQAIDTANDGLVIAEREGDDTILLYVNEAFERLTGYAEEEILYQDCRFLQGDDRDQRARQSIREAIESNQPSRTRLRNYHKDGSLFWNELSITPIINEEDGLTYYIGVQKDVTREVEIELQLEQAQLEIQRLRNQLSE